MAFDPTKEPAEKPSLAVWFDIAPVKRSVEETVNEFLLHSVVGTEPSEVIIKKLSSVLNDSIPLFRPVPVVFAIPAGAARG